MGQEAPRILIDPGHGGTNWGCIWPPPPSPTRIWDEQEGTWIKQPHEITFKEKDYVLDLAYLLASRCDKAVIATALTRANDANAEYTTRAKFARARFDLVVALHVNSFHDPDALRGASAFYWPGSVAGEVMAQGYIANLPHELEGNAQRLVEVDAAPWKKHARYIIGCYDAPCMLAEVGFISNEKDREYLLSVEGRDATVKALFAGVEAGVNHLKGIIP